MSIPVTKEQAFRILDAAAAVFAVGIYHEYSCC